MVAFLTTDIGSGRSACSPSNCPYSPSDWTTVAEREEPLDDGPPGGVYYRVATVDGECNAAASGCTFAWQGGNEDSIAVICEVTGADGSAVDASSEDGNPTGTPTALGITTATDAIVFYFAGKDHASGHTLGCPVGPTCIGTYTTSSGGLVLGALAYEINTGATGNQAFVESGDNDWSAFSVSFALAP